MNKFTPSYLAQKFGTDPAIRERILEALNRQKDGIEVKAETRLGSLNAGVVKYCRDNGLDASKPEDCQKAIDAICDGTMTAEQKNRVVDRYGQNLVDHGVIGTVPAWTRDTAKIASDLQFVARATKQVAFRS